MTTIPTLPQGFEPLARALADLDQRIGNLEQPGQPGSVYACLKAQLPAAASFVNGVARVTDTNILVASDGVNWINQHTGSAV